MNRTIATPTDLPQLKRIPVEQLRLGMHLHALDGAWLDHPFWRTRFTLTDAADLEALRRSGLPACWIDVDKGLDVGSAEAVEPLHGAADAPDDTAVPAPLQSVRSATGGAAPTVAFVDEVQRAATLVRRARGVVEALYTEARLGRVFDVGGCRDVVANVSASVMRHPGALVSVVRLKSHDDYTYLHSVAVCALMVALASELGLDEAAQREAGLAGLLHDVGKAGVPLHVLNKPGRLDVDEWELMRTHTERGYEMLERTGGIGTLPRDVCLHHHERMDGTGYPHRLCAESLPVVVRMAAVCDVYDAVTSARAYKPPWDPSEAIARMATWTGQFDAGVFSAFVRCLGIYPVGSLVRLASGRLAVVTEQNPTSLLAPKVKVFYSTKADLPIPTESIDLAKARASDRIVSRESRTAWGFDDLDVLWGAPPRR